MSITPCESLTGYLLERTTQWRNSELRLNKYIQVGISEVSYLITACVGLVESVVRGVILFLAAVFKCCVPSSRTEHYNRQFLQPLTAYAIGTALSTVISIKYLFKNFSAPSLNLPQDMEQTTACARPQAIAPPQPQTTQY